MLAYFLFKIVQSDLRIREIPDEYSIGICIMAVGLGGFSLSRLNFALAFMLFSSLLMGMGDAKLFGALTLLLGRSIISVFCLSFILAGIYCLLLFFLSFNRREMPKSIPFAPFIAITTLTIFAHNMI